MINLCTLLRSWIISNYFTDNLGYPVLVGKPGYSKRKSDWSLGISLLILMDSV